MGYTYLYWLNTIYKEQFMKRLLVCFAACTALSTWVTPSYSQQSTPCPCAQKSLPNGITQDDMADLTEAVARGYGTRVAVGPYREVTLACRQYIADLKANRPEAASNYQAAMNEALGRTPNPARACKLATAAVIFLEVAPLFGLNIPDYAQALALAQQLQAQACSTPVPTPVPVPVPTTKHATGLKQLPKAVRDNLHARDALSHRDFHAKHGAITLPTSIDLRGTTAPPVQDQGQCGSCHDFSGVECVSGANMKAGNLPVDSMLSVQYVIDSCAEPNDGACSGGDAETIFAWAQQGGGLPLLGVYKPYVAYSGQCSLSTTATGYSLQDWGYADTTTGVASVQAVKEALVTYGTPISICIGADRLQSYTSGIVTYDLSSGIDHQIIIVGYVDDATVAGGGYWICQNSWGTSWGEQGYFRASYSSNPTTEAMYAIAAAGHTVVLQPSVNPGPTPTPAPPTRRSAALWERVGKVYETAVDDYNSGDPQRKEKAMQLLQAWEQQIVPASEKHLGLAK
jgi:C1A family cysteine protease